MLSLPLVFGSHTGNTPTTGQADANGLAPIDPADAPLVTAEPDHQIWEAEGVVESIDRAANRGRINGVVFRWEDANAPQVTFIEGTSSTSESLETVDLARVIGQTAAASGTVTLQDSNRHLVFHLSGLAIELEFQALIGFVNVNNAQGTWVNGVRVVAAQGATFQNEATLQSVPLSQVPEGALIELFGGYDPATGVFTARSGAFEVGAPGAGEPGEPEPETTLDITRAEGRNRNGGYEIKVEGVVTGPATSVQVMRDNCAGAVLGTVAIAADGRFSYSGRFASGTAPGAVCASAGGATDTANVQLR